MAAKMENVNINSTQNMAYYMTISLQIDFK